MEKSISQEHVRQNHWKWLLKRLHVMVARLAAGLGDGHPLFLQLGGGCNSDRWNQGELQALSIW